MKKLNLNSAIYVGIDVHTLEHTAIAINRFEEELGKLSFVNNKKGIKEFLCWLKKIERRNSELKQTIIGIEGSGGNGRTLASMVTKEYSHVYEVNPLYTKQRREYGTRRDKSDEKDAHLIAEVLTKKLNQLPRISLNQPDSQLLSALRELMRYYDDLISQRTKLKNQLYPFLRQQGVLENKISFSQKQIKRYQQRFSKTNKANISWEERTIAMIIRQKFSQIKRLNLLIKKAEEEIKSLFAESKYQNLITMRGLNVILGAKIISESKGIERFKNINKFIQYAGLAPKEKSSGKTRKHQKSKQGNRRLNSAFYLLALNQLRWNDKAKGYFKKKVSEGKSKKHALRCLMKRSACLVYGMMRTNQPYRAN